MLLAMRLLIPFILLFAALVPAQKVERLTPEYSVTVTDGLQAFKWKSQATVDVTIHIADHEMPPLTMLLVLSNQRVPPISASSWCGPIVRGPDDSIHIAPIFWTSHVILTSRTATMQVHLPAPKGTQFFLQFVGVPRKDICKTGWWNSAMYRITLGRR